MSQSGSYFDGTINGDVETLTGDSGGPVGPDASFNINVLGGNHITTVGNPGTNSITIDLDGDIAETYVTDSGSATPAAGILNVLTNNATREAGQTVLFSAPGASNTVLLDVTVGTNTTIGFQSGGTAMTGTGNTALGSGSLSSIDTGSNNTVMGFGAAFPLTSGSDNVVMGTQAAGFGVLGSQNVAIGRRSLSASSGLGNTALGSESLNSLTTGSTNISIGYLSSNNYNGAETGNLIIANAGITGESNTIRIGGVPAHTRCFISGIYGVNPAGSNERTAVIDSSGQLGTITQTDGQVLIGSTGATPVAATLTPGTGVSITNGAGSITIDSSGGGLAWNVETGATAALLEDNGYIANRSAATCTMTLPATSAVGSIIRVTGIDNATGWRIAQNAGQTIHFGTSSTTTGVVGYLESTATRDSVELVCVVADTDFNVLSSVGNPTVN